jgi:hypothetical protein
METEGSLPCSQEPATGPYLHLQPHFPKTHFNIIIIFTPRFPSGLFPSDFPTKILYAFLISPLHTIPPAYLFLLYFIILIMFGEEIKWCRFPNIKFHLNALSAFRD